MTVGLTPNIPGIIPYVPEEVAEFDSIIAKFKSNEMTEQELVNHRLPRGVYGQRQPDRQMMRIKIPLGFLHANQLDVLADVIEKYAPLGKGHFTTRENMQIHHIPLVDTTTIMRMLGAVGLTTREACGNTVRNVTGCALAGVCPDELFDATPYASAFARYFVRRDFAQKMPRKFKTAFVGCKEDHAVVRIHDMGFVGVVREIDGKQVRGFRIVVGGGTSIEAIIAPILYDFITVDDGSYLRVTEAVLRVFNKADELRKNRMRARIKILIKRIGIDAFRALVEEELKQPWSKDAIDMPSLLASAPGEGKAPAFSEFVKPSASEKDFPEWVRTNTVRQKQAGYFAAFVSVPLGDVTPEQSRGLAAVARKHGTSHLRVSFDQNVAIRWIPGGSLYGLWKDLVALGLGAPGARKVTDVVSCPGTDSCKLGITSSMGLNRAVRDVLAENPDLVADPLIEEMHIRISGCPNGCGQHHLGDLGFHGACRVGEQKMQLPAYEAFIGAIYEDTNVRYGLRLRGKVLAKKLPSFIVAVLSHYRAERQEGERFAAFVDRVGRAPFESIIAQFDELPAFNPQAPGFYQDWDRTALYKVERGEGECAM